MLDILFEKKNTLDKCVAQYYYQGVFQCQKTYYE